MDDVELRKFYDKFFNELFGSKKLSQIVKIKRQILRVDMTLNKGICVYCPEIQFMRLHAWVRHILDNHARSSKAFHIIDLMKRVDERMELPRRGK